MKKKKSLPIPVEYYLPSHWDLKEKQKQEKVGFIS